MTDNIDRRTFVQKTATTAAAAAVAPMIVPRHVLGRGFQAPSDTLHFASVGIGGMGMNNLSQLLKAGERCVAIADADFGYVERSLTERIRPWDKKTPEEEADGQRLLNAYQTAKRYGDFRDMIAHQKDIDAVVVATPDHLHATVAYHAMKAGKHV